MGSLVIFGAVGFVLLFWIIWTRSARQRWVRDLDLIGQWDLEGDNPDQVRIEFIGTRGDQGNYMASEGDTLESGNWHLTSYYLVLEQLGGESNRYELRRFDQGLIGINGPARPYQTYRKKKLANVIKLHEHHTKNP